MIQETVDSDSKLHSFDADISHIDLPKKFTFPFYYEPHSLTMLAAKQLQDYLLNQKDWKHNFGLDPENKTIPIGKMFGVLVVKNKHGKIGFLAAFSGKLADSNDHRYFVPPVYDLLKQDGFFKQEEIILNRYNRKIEALENNYEYKVLKAELIKLNAYAEKEIESYKDRVKIAKKRRKTERNTGINTLSEKAFAELKEEHKNESLEQQFFLKELIIYWNQEIDKLKEKVNHFEIPLKELKSERKNRSSQLQKKIFNEYSFLNAEMKKKSLYAIFKKDLNITPPAGAGECAAPKLLDYAFNHEYNPIAMAEFWWGAPPGSEIRKHKQFYPACRGKCEPILNHMLKGLEVDDNPMLSIKKHKKPFEIIYEDEYLLAVNKSPEILSVPGKNIKYSVQNSLKEIYPDATGPLLVHRLDMSTSGILIAAKNLEIHKAIQAQFIRRTIKKRYIAILENEINQEHGMIDLPLRVDLDNRPHQLVCFEHGKTAKTRFRVIEIKNGKTRLYFYPITGRTHQLRVHAAHQDGLNSAIVGDDLYGVKADRLHLHAEKIEFMHPITKNKVIIQVDPDF